MDEFGKRREINMSKFEMNLNNNTKAKKQIELENKDWEMIESFIKFLDKTKGKSKGKKLEKYSSVISNCLNFAFDSNDDFKEFLKEEENKTKSKENKSALNQKKIRVPKLHQQNQNNRK